MIMVIRNDYGGLPNPVFPDVSTCVRIRQFHPRAADNNVYTIVSICEDHACVVC